MDRAALDAAMDLGMDYGGSVPRGRRAEDGILDKKYDRLTELAAEQYRVRTEKNVIDGDGTLVFTIGEPTEGTAYTVECAKRHGKPYLVIDLARVADGSAVKEGGEWLGRTKPEVLNVAGPRESKAPGIYRRTRSIISSILRNMATRP